MPAKRFPIRGGFYALTDRHWSQQDVLNLIPVPAETPGTKTEFKLDSYGLRPFVEIGTGAIRGLHNVEGKFFAVSGTQLYQILNGVAIPRGNIPGVGRVSMAHNQHGGGHQLVIDNGAARYVYDDVTLVLEKVTDPSFPGSFCAFYVDQYLGFVEPQGRYWGHSDLADATDYNSLDTYEAEADPDRIVWAHVSHREVLIFGQDTIEPYVNTPVGDGTAPFQRAANTVIECGLGAKYSVQSMDSATFFLDDKRQVRELRGYQAQRISNAGVEEALAECSPEAIARAYAFTWQHGPHKVYYLTVPGYITFGFDLLTREWHRRSSPGKPTWRLSSLEFWDGEWVGGDASTGKLYTLDADYCFDGTEELEREYSPGVLFADQRGVEVNEIEVLVTPGNPTDTVGTFPAQPEGPTISGTPDTGYVGFAYDFDFTTDDGTPPRVVTHRSGTLPPGITHDAGNLSGTPTTAGTYADNTFRVTDAVQLWDDATHDLVVEDVDLATLVAAREFYTGDPATLSLDAGATGFDSTIDCVRISPDGHFLAGSDRADTGSNRFMWARFDPATAAWVVLTNPSDLPPAGPNAMAWSHSGDYLAVYFNSFPAARCLIVYKRTGNTLAPIADPASFPANVGGGIAWNHDDTRLAVCIADTGKMLGVYDFDAATDTLSNFRTASGLALGNQGVSLAFLDGTNTVVCGAGSAIAVFSIDPTVTKTAHHNDAITHIPDCTSGVHWISADTIATVGQNNGPNFVRFWNWTGAAITVQGNAADQPSGTPSGSALLDGYLAIANTTTQPFLLDCTADPPTGDGLAIPASASSVATVDWRRS